MNPRVYRQSPGRWFVRTHLLPFDVGPFTNWPAAHRWALIDGRLWT